MSEHEETPDQIQQEQEEDEDEENEVVREPLSPTLPSFTRYVCVCVCVCVCVSICVCVRD